MLHDKKKLYSFYKEKFSSSRLVKFFSTFETFVSLDRRAYVHCSPEQKLREERRIFILSTYLIYFTDFEEKLIRVQRKMAGNLIEIEGQMS